MKPFPLTRCVFVGPFTSILNEMGGPTASLLAKFHLPAHPEEKPNHYIPLVPALRFATAAQRAEGIVDFGFHAGMRLNFGALSNSFQASVRHSPTLLAALQRWCRFVQLEDTFLRFSLERHGDSLRICSTNMVAGAAEIPHLEHSQWLQNMMTIYIIRQFAGPDWMPANFGFQARYTPSAKTQSVWPNMRFLSGQKASWIDIPISQLSLPIRARNRVPSRSQAPFRPIDIDIVNTLKLMLSTYLDERVPTIAETAEIVGTSVRSLQRELAAADLTYSRLLDEVRFENAIEMLRKTRVRITDAAYASGYANPTHFTRAFRRFTGITPREFRARLDAY